MKYKPGSFILKFIVISLQPISAWPWEVAVNPKIQALKALYRIDPNKLHLTGLSMGGHTEFSAKYYGITREDQDLLAFESHQKMAKAYEEGFFKELENKYFGAARAAAAD